MSVYRSDVHTCLSLSAPLGYMSKHPGARTYLLLGLRFLIPFSNEKSELLRENG